MATLCNAKDYYDDMYPEFAPEPIVVPCDEPATFTFVWFGPPTDEYGYPLPGAKVVSREHLCDTHTCAALAWADDENPFCPPDDELRRIDVIA